MKVKGSALRARLAFVQDQGEDAWGKFVAALQPEARAQVESGIVLNGWYPFDVFVNVVETIDRLHGRGDLSFVEALARDACDRNLTTLYRLFFKLGSPHFIIRRSAAMWHTNYDHGEMRVLEEDVRQVRVRIVGVPRPNRAHCLSVKGWAQRALELSGARNVQVTERCRVLGDEFCELHAAWE